MTRDGTEAKKKTYTAEALELANQDVLSGNKSQQRERDRFTAPTRSYRGEDPQKAS